MKFPKNITKVIFCNLTSKQYNPIAPGMWEIVTIVFSTDMLMVSLSYLGVRGLLKKLRARNHISTENKMENII